jgi:hypothetical protein
VVKKRGHTMHNEPEGQLPNTAGVLEDPTQIPKAPVTPESVAVEVDPEVEASYVRAEEETS